MPQLVSAAALRQIFSLDEFEPLARERMDPAGFDYVAGGAWDEITLRESAEAWRRRRFIPRVLTDVRSVATTGSFLGREAAIPVAMAPMAVQRLAHPDGEVEAVRGAARAGIPYVFSTAASRTMEEVAQAAPDAERWFQLLLGATGTLVGRPLYWSLATGGAAGIERAVTILRDEIATALSLLGVER